MALIDFLLLLWKGVGGGNQCFVFDFTRCHCVLGTPSGHKPLPRGLRSSPLMFICELLSPSDASLGAFLFYSFLVECFNMPKQLIVANWKLNPASQKEAKALFDAIKKGAKNKNAEVIICPPFVYLPMLKGLALGAQNIFWENISNETWQRVNEKHNNRRKRGEHKFSFMPLPRHC